jgi:Holliday junction resolvase-like predicted endonuclease
MTTFTKTVVEDAALAWLEALGYTVLKVLLREAIGTH